MSWNSLDRSRRGISNNRLLQSIRGSLSFISDPVSSPSSMSNAALAISFIEAYATLSSVSNNSWVAIIASFAHMRRRASPVLKNIIGLRSWDICPFIRTRASTSCELSCVKDAVDALKLLSRSTLHFLDNILLMLGGAEKDGAPRPSILVRFLNKIAWLCIKLSSYSTCRSGPW